MPNPLPMNPSRRQILALVGGIGGLGALALAGCGGDDSSASGGGGNGAATRSTTSTTGATTATSGATAAASTTCAEIPEETAGPYPGDGSNGPNVLTQSGVVRRDIRSSFGSASGVAGGVPLTLALTVVQLQNGCKPLNGAAVYAWHCDREGRYSMYSQGATSENYLRGVQAADANGALQFLTVFPGAYTGRWPHIHFEVYQNTNAATSGGSKLATSQLALPQDTCNAVYATDGYSASVRNLASTSLQRDMVFADGYSLQMPTVTGSPTSGYTANLTIAV